MQVRLTTDNHIQGSEKLTRYVEDTVTAAMQRFNNRFTRVEVHLADENGHKSGDADTRCVMEARPAGHQPLVVTHHAPNVDYAIDGALEKLERLVEHTFAKIETNKGRMSLGGTSADALQAAMAIEVDDE